MTILLKKRKRDQAPPITGDGTLTLAEIITRSGCGLPESTVTQLTRDILIALTSMHNNSVVALSTKSILLVPALTKQRTYITKINVDFGRHEIKYMSPEAAVCDDDDYGNVGRDVWAIGCIVLEMLTGKNTWEGAQDDLEIEGLLCRIGKGHGFLKLSNEIMSKDAQAFLKACLAREAADRLTAEELLNHPFVAAAAAADGMEKEIVVVEEGMADELDFIPLETAAPGVPEDIRPGDLEEEGTEQLDFMPLEVEDSRDEAVDFAGEDDDEFIPLEVEDLTDDFIPLEDEEMVKSIQRRR